MIFVPNTLVEDNKQKKNTYLHNTILSEFISHRVKALVGWTRTIIPVWGIRSDPAVSMYPV